MQDELEAALRYRNYAEELRLIAADKTVTETRDMLLSAAKTYDRMADSYEALDRSRRATGVKGTSA